MFNMSQLTNSPLLHPHVNVNGTCVVADLCMLTHVLKKESAIKSLAAISGSAVCIIINDTTWDLMAELEGLGHALSKYVRVVQTENCFTGGYSLVMYFDT